MQTSRVPRSASAFSSCIVLAILAWPLPAHAASFESQFWTIDVNSVSTRAENGKAADFEDGSFNAISHGDALGLSSQASEEWEPRARDNSFFQDPEDIRANTEVFDDPATYSLSASNTTNVQITCKHPDPTVPGDFTGSMGAEAHLEVGFQDGFDFGRRGALDRGFNALTNAIWSGSGTGFAKGAVGFRSVGDLEYDQNPAGAVEGFGLARSQGEDPGLGGNVELPGLSLPFQVATGQGRVTPAVTRNDFTSKAGATYQFELQNDVYTEMKGDDSFLGAAHTTVHADVSHSALVTATCRDNAQNLRSSLEFRLQVETDPATPLPGSLRFRTVAIVDVTTRNTGTGTETERFPSRRLVPVTAVFSRTPLALRTDERWGPVPGPWSSAAFRGGAPPLPEPAPGPPVSGQSERRDSDRPAHASRRLGVKKGAVVKYGLAARRRPLKLVKSLRLRVVRANAKTGRLLLSGAVGYRNGKTSRSRLEVNAFTGEGELRALLVPTGLTLGQRIQGIGRVVRRRDNTVTVRYKVGRARAIGVYDRRSGWLRKMTSGNPRHPSVSITRVHREGPVTAKSRRAGA